MLEKCCQQTVITRCEGCPYATERWDHLLPTDTSMFTRYHTMQMMDVVADSLRELYNHCLTTHGVPEALATKIEGVLNGERH